MSKVFLVQNPSTKDKATGEWVSKYDVSSAKQYGELVELLPPGNLPHDLEPALVALERKLSAFDPDQDHILALGDPVAIAAVIMTVVARYAPGGGPDVSVLKWDRRMQRYRPYRVPYRN